MIDPFLIPLIIIGGKYDVFQVSSKFKARENGYSFLDELNDFFLLSFEKRGTTCFGLLTG